MMTSGASVTRRLDTLERRWAARVCSTCHGHPSRLVVIDPETGEETSESISESGCLDCGLPVWREIHLVGADVSRL